MAGKNIENEIIRLALEELKKNVHMQVDRDILKQDYKAGRLLWMTIHGIGVRFNAEVRVSLNKAVSGIFQIQKGKYPGQVLLITRYVNGQMAEQLKENGVEFIDTAGNAYINQPQLYLFIKGNRPSETLTKTPLKRTFQPAGLRVIYAFLSNTGLENKPYREIAVTTGVALGTVGWLMRELKELGYLLEIGKHGNKVIKKAELFQQWVAAYPEKLRPKLVLGRFAGEQGWWQKRTLNPFNAQWGGEAAAAKLTKYLKPQIITIYTTPQQLNQLVIENRLRKKPAGDVEVIERFWKVGEERPYPYKDLVHPMLIYADLIASGIQRNIETAKVVYEQHIVQLIRED